MNLASQILAVLASASGHPLMLSVLRAQVELRMRPRPLKAVFDAALEEMQNKGHILQRENELDADDPYFQLDERGEALAHKLRL
jgi:hypothetical protein